MTTDYRITTANPPDRERTVSEIFFDNVQWAEVNQECELLRVEFYPRPDGKPWCIALATAVAALKDASSKLGFDQSS